MCVCGTLVSSCHLCPQTVGLCGNPRITDVGGVPYLVPLVQKHKVGFYESIAWRWGAMACRDHAAVSPPPRNTTWTPYRRSWSCRGPSSSVQQVLPPELLGWMRRWIIFLPPSHHRSWLHYLHLGHFSTAYVLKGAALQSFPQELISSWKPSHAKQFVKQQSKDN